MRQEPDAQPDAWRIAFLACLWIALGGSLIELTVLGIRQLNRPLLRVSADYPATVPVALIVTALLSAAPFIAASARRRRAGYAAVFAATSVTLFDLFLLIPRLAPWAALLLAAGAASRMAAVMWRNPARLRRATSRSLPIIAGLLVLVAVVIHVRTALTSPAMGRAIPAGPNVLLITLDTVRAANLSLYGYGRNTTPNLTRYANGGVVFDLAFATAPWTLPSHASLMTGRWPEELSAGYESALDSRFPTLAEHFSSQGYRTAGFVANLDYCSRGTGLNRGFQRFDDYPRTLGQAVKNSTILRGIADNFRVRRLLANDLDLNRVTAPDLNRRMLQWLREGQGRPFFAFLNYFDAHEPYFPPSPFDRAFGPGRQIIHRSPLHHAQWDPGAPTRELSPEDLAEEVDAYDGGIAYLDQQVGALLDALRDQHILEHTLVVITADHGEEFAEHRVLEHGYSLYRNSLQVPLIVRLPETVPGGYRIEEPVSLRDIAATIVDLTGTASPADFSGTSLRPLWSGGSLPGDTSVLSQLRRPRGGQPDWYPVRKGDMQAIVNQGLRYIRNGDGSEELYALDDPLERRNLAGLPEYQGMLAAARARLDASTRGR